MLVKYKICVAYIFQVLYSFVNVKSDKSAMTISGMKKY